MRTFTALERLLARWNLLPVPIYDVFAAPLLGHSLSHAVRLGIFDILSEPASLGRCAERANIDQRACLLLLSTLASAGYVRRAGTEYGLTPLAKKWLSQSSPSYLGNFIRYVELLYAHWLYLGDTLRTGEPPVTYFESFGEKEWEIYTNGMMDLARTILPLVLHRLKLPKNATQLLDIGGSHGLYSFEVCKRNSRLNATIIDFPAALKFTDAMAKRQGLADRVSLSQGDVLDVALPDGFFDAAFAFNFVHGLREHQNRTLFGKVFRTLKPEGYFYVLDQLLAGKRENLSQFIPLMMGLNLLNEVGGTVYRIEELVEWARGAGFGAATITKLRLPGVVLLRFKRT